MCCLFRHSFSVMLCSINYILCLVVHFVGEIITKTKNSLFARTIYLCMHIREIENKRSGQKTGEEKEEMENEIVGARTTRACARTECEMWLINMSLMNEKCVLHAYFVQDSCTTCNATYNKHLAQRTHKQLPNQCNA